MQSWVVLIVKGQIPIGESVFSYNRKRRGHLLFCSPQSLVAGAATETKIQQEVFKFDY